MPVKSTLPILISSFALCVPLLAFSIVLLALVFHYHVETVSSQGDEIPGGFYLVNFPAARLIFVSSWSNTIAPRLVAVATAMYLFPVARSFLKGSAYVGGDRVRGLLTPYQLALTVGLSGGSLPQALKYLKYRFKRSSIRTPWMLANLGLVFLLFELLGLGIFILDFLLHVTTDSVQYQQSTTRSQPQYSFSQALSSQCVSVGSIPCTYDFTATNEGFTNASEISATLAGVSATHGLLNTTTQDARGLDAQLIILGPAPALVPDDLQFTSSSIGVSTSCQPISRRCALSAPIGAATTFRCSPAFYGNIQIPQVNTTADYWSTTSGSTSDNFLYGAEFFDWNMSDPYDNYAAVTNYAAAKQDIPSTLPSSFHLAVAARTAFGTNTNKLQSDPDITLPEHGGIAFVLGCNVTALNVTYTFLRGAISDVQTTPASGYTTWLYNSVLGAAGSLAHLSQGVDTALAADTADALATTWSRFYSEEAVAILASVHEPALNTNEIVIQSFIVTKIARGPLFALVAINLLFALLGLAFGIAALWADSAEVSAVYRGLGVEGLVAALFESGGGMVVGRSTNDSFLENRNAAVPAWIAVRKEALGYDFERVDSAGQPVPADDLETTQLTWSDH